MATYPAGMPSSGGNSDVRTVVIRRYEDALHQHNIPPPGPDEVQAEMPAWLQQIYMNIVQRLDTMGHFIHQSLVNKQNPETQFPGLVAQYEQLLQQQYDFYMKCQVDRRALLQQRHEDFAILEIATQNFAWQVNSALDILKKENQDGYEELQNALNNQIANVQTLEHYSNSLVNHFANEMDKIREELHRQAKRTTTADNKIKILRKK